MDKKNRIDSPEELGMPHLRRRSFAKIRPVSQVCFVVPCGGVEGGVAQAFENVRGEILKWASNRAGRLLPDEAWQGDSFELESVGGQPVEATHLEDPVYYALRMDDADKNVPRRHWKTEFAIAKKTHSLMFGARLFCVTMGEDPRFDRSIPGLVRQVIESHGAVLDRRSVGEAARIVGDEGGVDWLVDLLGDPRREHDVCVVSTRNNSENPSDVLINANALFVKTMGAVHVVVLTSEASFKLSAKLGKEFSVFGQAVRTYHPEFDPENSEPYDHPLATAQKILSWEGGVSAFEKFLIAQSLRQTVSASRKKLEEALPPYAAAKEAARRQEQNRKRKDAKSNEELLAVAEAENEDMQRQREKDMADQDALLGEAEKERDEAIAERNEARNRVVSLEARIQYLESLSPREAPVIPKNFDGLEDWSRKHLAGKVQVLNRAVRAAENSQKECGPGNIRLAYESLLILRDCYVPMRREGGKELKAEYQRRLQEKGLEETSSFAGAGAGRHGETYFVKHAGRRRELERHLKKGAGKNCFRLYFFWDEEARQVVVGSFPKHLPMGIM